MEPWTSSFRLKLSYGTRARGPREAGKRSSPDPGDPRAARTVAGCDAAPAVGLLRDATPLCQLMSEFHVETFRATAMIVDRFGQIRPTLVHDHEPATGHRGERLSAGLWVFA